LEVGDGHGDLLGDGPDSTESSGMSSPRFALIYEQHKVSVVIAEGDSAEPLFRMMEEEARRGRKEPMMVMDGEIAIANSNNYR
jgi:hypothetical protein